MKTIAILAMALSISFCTYSQDPTKKVLQQMGLGGKNKVKAKDLPNSYDFNWELKTQVTSGKQEKIDLNFLINGDTKDYVGMEMSSKELKGGMATMVFDNTRNVSVMFMAMQGQKMAQVNKIRQQNTGKNEPDFSFKEIGTKEILGFTCYGIETESKNYIGTMYFTLDAPVNFSALFAMSNNKNMPKGFDPALLQVLEEEALLLEVTMQHKKKKKERMTMTATSLKEKKTELRKDDYQFMSMGF